jgi:hypothetical protein
MAVFYADMVIKIKNDYPKKCKKEKFKGTV